MSAERLLTAFSTLLDEHEGIVSRIMRRTTQATERELARLDEIERHVFAWVEDEDYPTTNYFGLEA